MTMKEQWIIERQARDKAAKLIRKFLKHEITESEFDEQWPPSDHDRSIKILGEVLLDTRLSTHIKNAPDDFTPEEVAVWKKARLFLLTDKPYEWPDVDWGRLEWGLLDTVTLLAMPLLLLAILYTTWPNWIFLLAGGLGAVLVIVVAVRSRRAGKREPAAIAAFGGDLNYWPFASGEDMETAQTQFGNLGTDKTQ